MKTIIYMLNKFHTVFRTIPTRMASRVKKEEGRVLLAEFMYIGLLGLGLSVLEFTCSLFFIQLAIIFSTIR